MWPTHDLRETKQRQGEAASSRPPNPSTQRCPIIGILRTTPSSWSVKNVTISPTTPSATGIHCWAPLFAKTAQPRQRDEQRCQYPVEHGVNPCWHESHQSPLESSVELNAELSLRSTMRLRAAHFSYQLASTVRSVATLQDCLPVRAGSVERGAKPVHGAGRASANRTMSSRGHPVFHGDVSSVVEPLMKRAGHPRQPCAAGTSGDTGPVSFPGVRAKFSVTRTAEYVSVPAFPRMITRAARLSCSSSSLRRVPARKAYRSASVATLPSALRLPTSASDTTGPPRGAASSSETQGW